MPNPTKRKQKTVIVRSVLRVEKPASQTTFLSCKSSARKKIDSGERRAEKNGEWVCCKRMRRVGKGSGEKFRWCGAEDKSGGLFSRFMAVICVGVFLRLLRQMARC
jgi:hypothetical protein